MQERVIEAPDLHPRAAVSVRLRLWRADPKRRWPAAVRFTSGYRRCWCRSARPTCRQGFPTPGQRRRATGVESPCRSAWACSCTAAARARVGAQRRRVGRPAAGPAGCGCCSRISPSPEHPFAAASDPVAGSSWRRLRGRALDPAATTRGGRRSAGGGPCGACPWRHETPGRQAADDVPMSATVDGTAGAPRCTSAPISIRSPPRPTLTQYAEGLPGRGRATDGKIDVVNANQTAGDSPRFDRCRVSRRC